MKKGVQQAHCEEHDLAGRREVAGVAGVPAGLGTVEGQICFCSISHPPALEYITDCIQCPCNQPTRHTASASD